MSKNIVILNKNGTEGCRGTTPETAPVVYGSGEFLYAYGTQANVCIHPKLFRMTKIALPDSLTIPVE